MIGRVRKEKGQEKGTTAVGKKKKAERWGFRIKAGKGRWRGVKPEPRGRKSNEEKG